MVPDASHDRSVDGGVWRRPVANDNDKERFRRALTQDFARAK